MTRPAELIVKPDCLICAVRAMTEGRPSTWHANEIGDMIHGVVLATGQTTLPMGTSVPTIDIWNGVERRRVVAGALDLRSGIIDGAPSLGDTVTIIYEGTTLVGDGQFKGRSYRRFTVRVVRGHHGENAYPGPLGGEPS